MSPLYPRPSRAWRSGAAGHPLGGAVGTVGHGVENQFHAARNPHLVEYPKQVFLDGVLAQTEFAGDLPVGEPIGNESDDLALLDAMAAGVCVLTSDIDENREVVDGAGFTFRRGDAADLERMLGMLLHNPELRRQAAIRERDRIRNEYLWPRVAQSIEKVYYQVLGRPAGECADPEGATVGPAVVSASAMD
ncbi:MAG: glycosyltransferase [Terriglobales bacterium]